MTTRRHCDAAVVNPTCNPRAQSSRPPDARVAGWINGTIQKFKKCLPFNSQSVDLFDHELSHSSFLSHGISRLPLCWLLLNCLGYLMATLTVRLVRLGSRSPSLWRRSQNGCVQTFLRLSSSRSASDTSTNHEKSPFQVNQTAATVQKNTCPSTSPQCLRAGVAKPRTKTYEATGHGTFRLTVHDSHAGEQNQVPARSSLLSRIFRRMFKFLRIFPKITFTWEGKKELSAKCSSDDSQGEQADARKETDKGNATGRSRLANLRYVLILIGLGLAGGASSWLDTPKRQYFC